MAYYEVAISSNIFQLIPYFILGVMAALGVGIWVSSLTIRYRDFQHIVPFMVQVGLYATPIAYPASMIPDKYQIIYHLNPVAGVVEGFRWSILGNEQVSQYAWISFVVLFILFITSLFYFKRVERVMADIV